MIYTEEAYSETQLTQLYGRENPQVVVVVDSSDNPIETIDRMQAHLDGGTLHRAFSIFVRDSTGRLLLQRRARTKYHFGGLWTNTCCGHAVPGEPLGVTVGIRLWQEMGICVALKEVGTFVYSATDPYSQLTEQEVDHVFQGVTDDSPCPDPDEVNEWRWVTDEQIDAELSTAPETFTPWFGLAQKELRNSE